MRTILPSSVSGSCSPVCVRMPSRTSCVRFSRSAIRSDCSLWRKRPPKRSRERGVERLLAGVPERRVAGVVAEADRLDEILVEPERAGDDAGDPGRLERVGHPRAVVVAGGVDEDLRLALQAPERLGVDDPVAVALERRPHVGLRLGPEPAARLVRAHRERRRGYSVLEPAHCVSSNDVAPRIEVASRDGRRTWRPAYPEPVRLLLHRRGLSG